MSLYYNMIYEVKFRKMNEVTAIIYLLDMIAMYLVRGIKNKRIRRCTRCYIFAVLFEEYVNNEKEIKKICKKLLRYLCALN